MILSELEGHFCCHEWQNASRGPSASVELLVRIRGRCQRRRTEVDGCRQDARLQRSGLKV